VKLEYRVVRSRRQTLELTVERDASVVVHAPEGTSLREIERAVARKRLWLYQKVNHKQKYPLLRTRKEFVSGETIAYLGRNYRLEVTDLPVNGVQFRSHFVVSRRARHRVAQLFRRWHTDRAREHIPSRAERFAAAMGVECRRIAISDLKVRWASCTPAGNLNFNWRIMKAPAPVVDYVIVHELAHLLEPNHTARFWNIVAVQVPHWQKAKDWLREHGGVLETDF
jgi:predicted metal-dependent hydrolase